MKCNLSIFSWNCQGCGNTKFPRIFREYSIEFKPEIVSLLETRISGKRADETIASLGFNYSYRIEASGFSGGIWLGWKDTVQVHIIHSHPQFILVEIKYGFPIQKLLIAFVYGSPNKKTKRSAL